MAVIPTTFFSQFDIPQETTLNLTGSGNFTGGSIKVSKAGNVITITAITAITHASLSTVTSAAALLPSWATPTVAKRNTFESTATGPYHAVIDVNTNGSITLSYLNATLVASVRTNGGSNLTITYNI